MKKKDNELATVLIANYNNSKYLKKCLLSVINQSYKNIQIILIDDNSKDKSLKIAKQFEDKVLIIKNKKKNRCWKLGSNKYLLLRLLKIER